MSQKQIEIPVYDSQGAEAAKLSLDLASFDDRLRRRLLRDAVVRHHANQRTGTHSTKTRGMVKGSNRKPWRQKGTGRARAGTLKSPLWRGGGIIFGPHPREHRKEMNKKQRRRALRTALYGKFLDGEVRVIERLDLSGPKTKQVAAVLKALGIEGSCLIGVGGYDKNLVLSTRNLPGVKACPVSDFNAYEVLAARTVVLTREGLERLQATSLEGARGAPKPTPEDLQSK